MIEDARTRYDIIEGESVCSRDQRSTCIQAQLSCASHIECGRILAIAETRAPDRFKLPRRQSSFTERKGEIARLPLHKSEPLNGPFGRVLMRRCETINFFRKRLGKGIALVKRS